MKVEICDQTLTNPKQFLHVRDSMEGFNYIAQHQNYEEIEEYPVISSVVNIENAVSLNNLNESDIIYENTPLLEKETREYLQKCIEDNNKSNSKLNCQKRILNIYKIGHFIIAGSSIATQLATMSGVVNIINIDPITPMISIPIIIFNSFGVIKALKYKMQDLGDKQNKENADNQILQAMLDNPEIVRAYPLPQIEFSSILSNEMLKKWLILCEQDYVPKQWNNEFLQAIQSSRFATMEVINKYLDSIDKDLSQLKRNSKINTLGSILNAGCGLFAFSLHTVVHEFAHIDHLLFDLANTAFSSIVILSGTLATRYAFGHKKQIINDQIKIKLELKNYFMKLLGELYNV